jgi:hypothetical protein
MTPATFNPKPQYLEAGPDLIASDACEPLLVPLLEQHLVPTQSMILILVGDKSSQDLI